MGKSDLGSIKNNVFGNEYSGFRIERYLMFLGIPIVGFIMTYILNIGQVELYSIEYNINLLATTIVTAINWLGCRFIVIKLWNKYPWHLHPLKHILIEVPIVFIFTIVLNISVSFLFIWMDNESLDYSELLRNTAIILLLVSFLVSLHEALFFYVQWKANFNKSLALEKANIKAEYDALKNQINPHFLFNNLNTLTTFVEDNPEATNYIQNLSGFLRYTLDIKETDIKSLSDELKMVKKYIYLQKIRFGNSLSINVDISQEFLKYKIPSMSLQMVVDNAIKHNIISNDKQLNINIFIENNSYLVIQNNLQKRYGVISTNQGLSNLRKRYSFISEKGVKVLENINSFIVKLPLVKR